MRRSIRTTILGICSIVGSTGAFLAFVLQTPKPPWVNLFAAASAWAAAMSTGIAHMLSADDAAIDPAIANAKIEEQRK